MTKEVLEKMNKEMTDRYHKTLGLFKNMEVILRGGKTDVCQSLGVVCFEDKDKLYNYLMENSLKLISIIPVNLPLPSLICKHYIFVRKYVITPDDEYNDEIIKINNDENQALFDELNYKVITILDENGSFLVMIREDYLREYLNENDLVFNGYCSSGIVGPVIKVKPKEKSLFDSFSLLYQMLLGRNICTVRLKEDEKLHEEKIIPVFDLIKFDETHELISYDMLYHTDIKAETHTVRIRRKDNYRGATTHIKTVDYDNVYKLSLKSMKIIREYWTKIFPAGCAGSVYQIALAIYKILQTMHNSIGEVEVRDRLRHLGISENTKFGDGIKDLILNWFEQLEIIEHSSYIGNGFVPEETGELFLKALHEMFLTYNFDERLVEYTIDNIDFKIEYKETLLASGETEIFTEVYDEVWKENIEKEESIK